MGRATRRGHFGTRYCHPETKIEAVAVWDTVKALGMRLPLIWRIAERRHAFHNHILGDATLNGFQALALNENRIAYAPVMWHRHLDWPGHMEQVWFRGSHRRCGRAPQWVRGRPSIGQHPLVWMLDRLEMCGLALPDGWQTRFEQDPDAPSVGTWRGWGWMFLARDKREVGRDVSESIHPTAKNTT